MRRVCCIWGPYATARGYETSCNVAPDGTVTPLEANAAIISSLEDEMLATLAYKRVSSDCSGIIIPWIKMFMIRYGRVGVKLPKFYYYLL
jgi:hypothetical protein